MKNLNRLFYLLIVFFVFFSRDIFAQGNDWQQRQVLLDDFHNAKTLHVQIESFRQNQFLEKKIQLIDQALSAIEFAKSIPPQKFRKICNPEREGRLISKQLGVYKKMRDFYREAIVWELSVLFNCDSFICPSIPIFIHGGMATFQPYYKVNNGGRFVKQDQKLPVAVSLVEFWKIGLFTFLAGLADLNGENLHYLPDKYFLLDNDISMPACNRMTITGRDTIYCPIQNVLVDYREASLYLDKKSLKRIEEIRAEWRAKKEEARNYFALSHYFQSACSESVKDAFWERWKALLESPIYEQDTFRAFISRALPEYFDRISNLQMIVEKMAGMAMGPMSALHFVCHFWKHWNNKSLYEKEICAWIESKKH